MTGRVLLAAVFLLALAGCRPGPGPSATPLPATPIPTPTDTALPPTMTATPSGMSGSVRYEGELTGGIIVFATDRLPEPNVAPSPVAIAALEGTSGEFVWVLPAGTYHVIAFLAINRPLEGPPQADEPLLRCAPIEIAADETVSVEIVLTDGDIGGQERPCVSTD